MKHTINSTEAYSPTTKSRYICSNCGVAVKKSYMKIYQDSGFAYYQIECPECGQNTIKDKDNE